MVVVEPVLTKEKLQQLLAEQSEAPQLDFKSTCDVSKAENLVELAKDVGAMAADGGFIVVGANDDGTPSGHLEARLLPLFDEANLRGKLLTYLPDSIEIRTAQHEINRATMVLIYVGRHREGFVIFRAVGNTVKGPVFREGEVFVRHGTRSERWQQSDMQRIFKRQVDLSKEAWRSELAPEIERIARQAQQSSLAHAPAEALSWQLDEDTFEASALELLRSRDEVVILRFLDRAAVAIADARGQSGGEEEIDLV